MQGEHQVAQNSKTTGDWKKMVQPAQPAVQRLQHGSLVPETGLVAFSEQSKSCVNPSRLLVPVCKRR